MKLIPVTGYHAYSDDGTLIATISVDSNGTFILDNGEDNLAFAADLEEAHIIHDLLSKILSEYGVVQTPNNILTIIEEEENT